MVMLGCWGVNTGMAVDKCVGAVKMLINKPQIGSTATGLCISVPYVIRISSAVGIK